MEQNLEDYLFDLRGYLHLKGAISAELVTQLNTELDPYVSMSLNEWNGNIHRLKPDEIHNIIEAGQGFEELIEVASGKKTKSEINEYGDDEFNPWVIGATM